MGVSHCSNTDLMANANLSSSEKFYMLFVNKAASFEYNTQCIFDVDPDNCDVRVIFCEGFSLGRVIITMIIMS